MRLPRGNCKVGSFSQNRPLSWCQGFVGKVNDPLRVGFSIWRTLVGPTGGCGGGVAFLGGCTGLLGRLCRPLPGGCLLPCLPALGGLLPCPAWVDLKDWGGLLLSLCRGREVAWEELFSSPEGKRMLAWEELTSSKGRCIAPGRALLPSLGGRWAIARVGRPPDVSRFPSDLMKSTVVDESLSSFKPMYCSREYQASIRLSQQYEKSTSKIYWK